MRRNLLEFLFGPTAVQSGQNLGEDVVKLFEEAADEETEQMVANKVHGVRAALCNDLYTARYSRLHNDANVLSIGARIVGVALADEIVRTWFSTDFEAGRHVARVDQITAIEKEETQRALAGWPGGQSEVDQ